MHKVPLDLMISDYLSPQVLQDWLSVILVEVLGFHPNDGDAVYLRILENLILCNVQGGVLRLVTGNNCCLFEGIRCFFLILIPWWSMPVPTLPGTQSRRLAPIPMRARRSYMHEIIASCNRLYLARRRQLISQ